MTPLVFTQGSAGEREWLTANLPAGKLTEYPFSNPAISNTASCYETYKSIYSPGTVEDKHWHLAEHLITNIEFSAMPNRIKTKYYQAFTFARAGTVFLENMLTTAGVKRKTTQHYSIESSDTNRTFIDTLALGDEPTIFLIYRKNWWEQLLSVRIAQHVNFYAHYTSVDSVKWDTVKPIELTESFFEQQLEKYIHIWNLWCNLRTMLPTFDFYIAEFSEFIPEFKDSNKHKAVPYNKQALFKNLDSAKLVFGQKYKKLFKQYEEQCIKHLVQMNCNPMVTKQDLGLS